MNRRDLLKAMAVSIPVLATNGCSVMNRPTESTMSARTLNVIFSGPMIFLMEMPQLRVLVPRISGHEYNIDHAAAASGTFTLRGAAGAADVTQVRYEVPQGADAFRLSTSQLHLALDTQKQPFFTLFLPLPSLVVALSARDADIVDAFGNRRIAVMPTSYAFVYDVTGPEKLELEPNPGWNATNRMVQGKFTNLLITGELPGQGLDPAGQHARAAFSEMTSFFPGLQMRFLGSGRPAQSGTVEGLPAELALPHSSGIRNSNTAKLVPAALNSSTAHPRLMLAAMTENCTTGGIIVTKP